MRFIAVLPPCVVDGPGATPTDPPTAMSTVVAGDRLTVIQGEAGVGQGVGGGLDRGDQAAADPDDDDQPLKNALHSGTSPLWVDGLGATPTDPPTAMSKIASDRLTVIRGG